MYKTTYINNIIYKVSIILSLNLIVSTNQQTVCVYEFENWLSTLFWVVEN